jgi:PAS domain S-box-containing protein
MPADILRPMYDKSPDFQSLRRRAEALMQRREWGAGSEGARALHELLHEIEVYSAELELQNEELKHTRDALQLAKDRYRDLYDFAPVAYFSLSREGLIRELNLAAAHLLGLARSRLVGRDFPQFVAAEHQGHFLSAFRRVVEGCEAGALELGLRHGQGGPVHVLAEIARNQALDGEELELRLVLTDISERKQLEEQRNMFFSIAGHELRTPLTNICLSLDLVLKEVAGRLDPEVRSTLEVARRGAGRLKKLTEDILALRNTQGGGASILARPVDLVPLVGEAVMLNNPFAQRCGVRVEMSRTLFQALVMGNEDRLIQVLNNLLNNAVKYSPAGAVVRVDLGRSAGVIRVSVADRGPGVDETLRHSIFEPFTQGEPSLEDERNRGSVGLGLSIGRAIIRQLGGSMDFDSRPGRGTVFYFELPEHVI